MKNYTDVELAWLAGLLEGEGCFSVAVENKRPTGISLNMTDLDIVARVAGWWGVSYNSPRNKEEHHKEQYRCTLRGQPSVDLMIKLKPYMGIRRSQKIDLCILSHTPKGVSRKISVEDARIVRDRYRAGEKPIELAKEYQISKWSVYAIHQGRVKLD